jgi:hypothetical protein
MKTLIPFVGFVMISLFCPKISLGQPHNLDQFRQVVVFGDSLSDNGNTFAQNGTPPPPYFEGRRLGPRKGRKAKKRDRTQFTIGTPFFRGHESRASNPDNAETVAAYNPSTNLTS